MPGRERSGVEPRDSTSASFSTSTLLVVLLVLLALYLFLQSAYFCLREVQISGLLHLTADEVRAAASLHPGVNFWNVDETAVSRKLLLHPRIEKAEVTRVFPNRLHIQVVELRPLGLLPYEGGFLELATGGHVLEFHPLAPEHAEVPFVSGIEVDAVGTGQNLAGRVLRGAELEPALKFSELIGSEGREQLSEINFEEGKLTLYTAAATPVMVGEPEQLKEKAELLLGMLADIEQNGLVVDYIDIRVPEHPVLKLEDK
jgi:cell division protein FtsQ